MLLKKFGESRVVNRAALSESGILGVCVGRGAGRAASDRRDAVQRLRCHRLQSAGQQRAKVRYRWGSRERRAMVVADAIYGGLRAQRPYPSQNTEPWFYRTPGLKIVVPSTPEDARALMASAVADPDPVLYYEHIALYRDPRIRQTMACRSAGADADRPRRVAPRGERSRHRLVWGVCARRHACRGAARERRHSGDVFDLRSLAPLDREALLALAATCHKGAHRARGLWRTGGIGGGLAPRLFREGSLPVAQGIEIAHRRRAGHAGAVLAALEEFYLPSEAQIERAARLLVAY